MLETNIDQSTDEIETTDKTYNLQEEGDNTVPEEQREKLLKLPLSRVKNICKVDPDVQLINLEATFLIAKSTELFIESFVREAYKYTLSGKKKGITKKDIENAVDNIDCLMFLEEMLT